MDVCVARSTEMASVGITFLATFHKAQWALVLWLFSLLTLETLDSVAMFGSPDGGGCNLACTRRGTRFCSCR